MRWFAFVVVCALALGQQKAVVAVQGDQASRLHIVVIEGEDAVNIIQQKTAVAPVVEVRDRNDQPVAGAVVRFAIRNGRASFSGARTLTVTTNAAGRAIASGLTPTGSGALQIGASAAFQGQTAVATIAQTNVMTIAQAAGMSGAASGGGAGAGSGGATGGASGAGSGGAAGGGGLSATTIGIVGGAVAGGAIAAKEVLGGGGPAASIYRGTFSGPFSEIWGSCTLSDATSGTVELTVDVAGDGTISGTARVMSGIVRQSGSAGCFSFQPGSREPFDFDADVTGSTSAISLRWQASNTLTESNCQGCAGSVFTRAFDFTGSLADDQVTGTVRLSEQTTAGATRVIAGSGSASYPVTMMKQ